MRKNRDKKTGTREIKTPFQEKELVFSFKYFNSEQAEKGIGQHFRDWESDTTATRAIKDIRNLVEKYVKEDNETKEVFLKDFLQSIQQVIDEYMQDNLKQGLLSDFFEKLIDLSSKTRSSAISKNKSDRKPIGIYEKGFDSEFTLEGLLPENAQWGTIKRIGGRLARVAGFLHKDSNVFYIVFLDKEHDFYKGKED